MAPLLLAPLLLVAACSGGTSATGSSPDEDKALDAAAASLDANATAYADTPDANTNASETADDGADGANESEPR